MDVGVLLDPAGVEGQPEGALEGGTAHRLGGAGGAQAVVALGWEQQGGMAMGFPLLAQEVKRALGQRDVTIGVALAAADVDQPPLGINVADFQMQAFAQAQAAGIDRGQSDPMIQGFDRRQNPAHFAGSEDHGQFELGLSADQDQFVGRLAAEGFFPKELDRAEGLGGGLVGDFLDRLEVNEVLADLFGGKEAGPSPCRSDFWLADCHGGFGHAGGGLAEMVAELGDTSVVSFDIAVL